MDTISIVSNSGINGKGAAENLTVSSRTDEITHELKLGSGSSITISGCSRILNSIALWGNGVLLYFRIIEVGRYQTLTCISCFVDESVPPESSMDVITVANNAGLNTFIQLLDAAGLVDTVNAGNLTIFAPTNAGFARALQIMGISLKYLSAHKEVLIEVLAYHVLPNPYMAADFGDGGSFKTLLGDDSSCGVAYLNVVVNHYGSIIAAGVTNAKVRTSYNLALEASVAPVLFCFRSIEQDLVTQLMADNGSLGCSPEQLTRTYFIIYYLNIMDIPWKPWHLYPTVADVVPHFGLLDPGCDARCEGWNNCYAHH